MKTKILKFLLKLVLALVMVPVSLVPLTASANDRGQRCEPKKKCDKAVAEFRQIDGVAGLAAAAAPRRSTGTYQDSTALQQTSSSNAAAAEKAKATCVAEKKNCKEPLCTRDDCKSIDNSIATMASAASSNTAGAVAAADTQAATGASPGESGAGGGGGNSALMTGLMGAALGAGLMMMMQKKDEDNQPQQQMAQAPYHGALQPNGSIDCSKADALAYRDCNSFLENRCKTILDDPTCQQFSSRYCGPSAGGGATIEVQPQTPPGVVFAVDPSTLYGARGEGMGSAYCRGVMGWNFCKVGGRGSCPSCLQIQRNQSPACAQNPALCLAQNSLGEIEKAKVSCPTDPAFADPAYAAGGGSQVPGSIAAAGGLPAVVLPQSVGTGNGATISKGSSAVSSGGISTQSAIAVAGTANGDQGIREGFTNGQSQASYDGTSGSIGGGVGSASFVGSGGREFASASDSATGFRPSSVNGPASDVHGQFAPSLFSTSSQVIRQRCQAGRLNNCP
jgi:hypothetical protein